MAEVQHVLFGEGTIELPHRAKTNYVPKTATVLTLVKDGDHRLSKPHEIELIESVLSKLIAARHG